MHINVYGPKASGKTRNAERLRKHYKCVTVIDEGGIPAGEEIAPRNNKRVLLLTIDPVRRKGVQNIHITTALHEIGGA